MYTKTNYELSGIPFCFPIKDQPFKMEIALYSDEGPTIQKTYLISFGDKKKFFVNKKWMVIDPNDIECANIEEIQEK